MTDNPASARRFLDAWNQGEGKLLRWRMFPDPNHALEAAGLNAAETAPPTASTDP
jgi:hypothetical protein